MRTQNISNNTEGISICIPTYEMGNNGVFFLQRIFDTLISQTFKNFDVIISDHSKNENIKNLCSKYENKLNIKYLKNLNDVGSSSANINNAILNSTFNIIKIIFQDDYIIDDNALLKISTVFNDKNINWLIHSTNVVDERGSYIRTVKSYWNDDIIRGRNTIGAPTAIAFRKSDILFDKNLIWLMDCDFYYSYFLKYGHPYIIEEPLCAVTLWEGSLSYKIPKYVKNNEYNYIIKKYNLNE